MGPSGSAIAASRPYQPKIQPPKCRKPTGIFPGTLERRLRAILNEALSKKAQMIGHKAGREVPGGIGGGLRDILGAMLRASGEGPAAV